MSEPYLTDSVALIRAHHFRANPETASSNAFQASGAEPGVAAAALREQAALAAALNNAGIETVWLEPPSDSPDGIFPNNWFSTHTDGSLLLYPMYAPSRRREVIEGLGARLRDSGFETTRVIDLRRESGDRCLEGTGSLVLDRRNRIAYACTSPRTDAGLARAWAQQMDYELHLFNATDPQGRAIYHTNVIMSLGVGLALVCFEAVAGADREALRQRLLDGGLEVVPLRWSQVLAFAGNQLFLQGRNGPVVALSSRADACLDEAQKTTIDRYACRVAVDIATIEKYGGGSVRCMLAEIFLPRSRTRAEGKP